MTNDIETDRSLITEAYKGGKSYAQIAENYGCHGSTIRNSLLRWGVELGKKTWSRHPASAGLNQMSTTDAKEMVQSYEAGIGLAELAAKYAVSAVTVSKKLRELGVAVRAQGSQGPEVQGDLIRCSTCDKLKHFTLFHKHPKNATGRFSACKECNKERYNLRMYNLKQEAYEALVVSHGGQCAICGCTAEDQRNHGLATLAIDHCHTQGHVRGLLCHSCNTMLGKAADNVDWLRRAAEYVIERANEKTPAV